MSSGLYAEMPLFPLAKYQKHCRLYEGECVRKAANRGYWSSPSTVVQFGPASVPKDINPPGSPRWKQRAFYDFLKDLSPELTGTPVARISIWETVELNGAKLPVHSILDRYMQAAVPALVELVERRSGAKVAG